MQELSIQPEAWGPFAEGGNGIFTNPVLTKIAEKYHKTAAQVILKWNIQRGVIVIPKSVKKERMQENFAVWDFRLDTTDMEQIAKLDLGKSNIIDHFTAQTAKFLNEYKIHD